MYSVSDDAGFLLLGDFVYIIPCESTSVGAYVSIPKQCFNFQTIDRHFAMLGEEEKLA